eukprot:scaffold16938_cov92-Isochrysis_galbana.AAC.1
MVDDRAAPSGPAPSVAAPRGREVHPDRRHPVGGPVGRGLRLQVLRALLLHRHRQRRLGQPNRPPAAPAHAQVPGGGEREWERGGTSPTAHAHAHVSDGEGTSTGVTLNCLSSIAPYIAVRALLLPTHPLSPFPACCLNRVVRGSLLAVGRPDGRLNALASAESAVCLSVNQASSIQHFGVTCESFTLGHN